jgi:hypothetical protein
MSSIGPMTEDWLISAWHSDKSMAELCAESPVPISVVQLKTQWRLLRRRGLLPPGKRPLNSFDNSEDGLDGRTRIKTDRLLERLIEVHGTDTEEQIGNDRAD